MPVLRDPHATPAAVRRAIAQLEPLVMPRGSPDYVIVGAIRRLFADWTREWVSEAMGGSHGDSSGALRAHDPGDSGGNKHGVMNA